MSMTLWLCTLFAQAVAMPPAYQSTLPKTYLLWSKDAPESLENYTQIAESYAKVIERREAEGRAFDNDAERVQGLDVPTITVYLPHPDVATGASVVICPGGGYRGLAIDHEGRQVAEWLNTLGVAGVILKYRLGPKYHHPAPLKDAQRAVRTVRARSREWNLDPNRVAILGFSAGGHLASTAATHFDSGRSEADDPIDREGCRPDRAILVYPVIAFATPYGHSGSRRNLLGEEPPEELVRSLSNETQVTKDTPPTFLAHTNEDAGVAAENSILFVLALRKAKVPVEFHLFEKGVHGLGLGTGSAQHRIPPNQAFMAWPRLCETWLKGQGFLDKSRHETR